jgi:transposase-like protein
MRELDFSRRTVRRQWQLVNQWYRDLDLDPTQLPSQMMQLVKQTIELNLCLQRDQLLEQIRQQGDWDKANGYYTRNLDTTFGSIEQMRVPRLRHHGLPTSWFRRYQRRWRKVDRLILQCFLGGLSTRKTAKILNRMFGWGLSPSLISRLATHLREALQHYRQCRLDDNYRALIIDGSWYRFRQLYGPKRVVLAVLGLRTDGQVVVLGFHIARGESTLEVRRLLQDLKQRGLCGRQLELIVADGSSGIEAAAAEVYPWAQRQRCCWHHLQLLKQYASNQTVARRMMRQAARCYHSRDAQTVQHRLQRFLNHWRANQPRATAAFAHQLDQTLVYLSLPPDWHRKVRTTNLLERLFRDLRGRARPIGSFRQPVHLEQLFMGTLLELTWIKLPVERQPLLAEDTII